MSLPPLLIFTAILVLTRAWNPASLGMKMLGQPGGQSGSSWWPGLCKAMQMIELHHWTSFDGAGHADAACQLRLLSGKCANHYIRTGTLQSACKRRRVEQAKATRSFIIRFWYLVSSLSLFELSPNAYKHHSIHWLFKHMTNWYVQEMLLFKARSAVCMYCWIKQNKDRAWTRPWQLLIRLESPW